MGKLKAELYVISKHTGNIARIRHLPNTALQYVLTCPRKKFDMRLLRSTIFYSYP